MNSLVVDAEVLAKLLDVGRTTFYELRKQPGFPKGIPVSKRLVKYRVADVEAWLAAQAGAVERPEPPELKAGRRGKSKQLAEQQAEPARERTGRKAQTRGNRRTRADGLSAELEKHGNPNSPNPAGAAK